MLLVCWLLRLFLQSGVLIRSPSGIGSICATVINGRQIDWMFRREERRVGGDYRKKGEEFAIDWTRIRCMFPFMA